MADWNRRYPILDHLLAAPVISGQAGGAGAIAYARDGYALLEVVYDRSSPGWLRELPAVDVLRRVLVQNYTRTISQDGREVIKRREKEPEGDGLPHGHARIAASPYDTDARWGVKREEFWAGLQAAHHRDLPPCPAVHLPAPAAAAQQAAEDTRLARAGTTRRTTGSTARAARTWYSRT